eukprot:CAMPEP_0185021532 /NCGR_PEP_ID=MMETSP1103-20130426/4215_1 /TAXON_ID=36769 /ORGANISM="Paraphysomonas bandaiensis, Strain Caron Lab Isolate" /LENGTH=379 /DNA_ID=CAMNT_0027553107 /DNA_START=70 /DNA_END=1209 /DNA_ORIENTATION=-
MGAASSFHTNLVQKSFATPDSSKSPDKCQLDTVDLGGGISVTKTTFQPGWKWSECIKPSVGTETCGNYHVGVCISGKLAVSFPDGTEFEVGPGDGFVIPPGHDGWVVGDDPAVMYEIKAEPIAPGTVWVKKSFEAADSSKNFEKCALATLDLGAGISVTRATYQPGWKWSECIKPVAETDLCGKCHVGVCGSGVVHVVSGETEVDIKADDGYVIPPNHDGWVVGEEACVTFDFEVFEVPAIEAAEPPAAGEGESGVVATEGETPAADQSTPAEEAAPASSDVTSSPEEAKVDVNEPKADESKEGEPKIEESKEGEVKTEESKEGEAKTEESKEGEVKAEESKEGEAKTEESKPEEAAAVTSEETVAADEPAAAPATSEG